MNPAPLAIPRPSNGALVSLSPRTAALSALLITLVVVTAFSPGQVLAQPLTSQRLQERLSVEADKVLKVTQGHSVERTAFSDYALPSGNSEFVQTGGLGVLFVAALSHDLADLPLKRVYLKDPETGHETDLTSILAVRIDDRPDVAWAELKCPHRYMALFPFRVALLATPKQLVVDFSKRNGFEISTLEPPTPPFPYGELLSSSNDLAPVFPLLFREFPVAREMLAMSAQVKPKVRPSPAGPKEAAGIAPNAPTGSAGQPAQREDGKKFRSSALWWVGGAISLVASYALLGRNRLRICSQCALLKYGDKQPCASCAAVNEEAWTRERAAVRERLAEDERRKREDDARRRREDEVLRARLDREVEERRAEAARRAREEEERRADAARRARAEEERRAHAARESNDDESRRRDEGRNSRDEARRQEESGSRKRKGAADPSILADAYVILGVSGEDPFESVKAVVKGLRVAYHPDKHQRDEGARQRAERRTQRINAAWETVKSVHGWRD